MPPGPFGIPIRWWESWASARLDWRRRCSNEGDEDSPGSARILRGDGVQLGTASYKTRQVRINNAPSDLPERVEKAMRAIHPSVVVARRGPQSVEGLRPGKFLEPVKSRVLATWEIDADGNALVTVNSSPADMTSIYSPRRDLLYADHGRSLENVEEFQLALRREVETSALAGGGRDYERATAPQGE